MVEYTVETLVHLYYSLNYQIERVQSDLADFNHIGLDPNLAEYYIKEIEDAHKRTEKRLEKLTSIRDDVEALLYKILKAEVNE